MSISRIAGRYAKSLLELAQENNILDEVRKDIVGFSDAAKVRDFYMLLKSPIIHGSKKKVILHEIFEGNSKGLTMSFYDIIISKGREFYLPEIAASFEEQYRALKGITTVKLTTATELSTGVLEKIKSKLESSTETKSSVEIETAVDPKLIGGFLFEFGDKLYDASVAHRLDQVRKEFSKE